MTQENMTPKMAREYRSWIRRQAGLRAGDGTVLHLVPGHTAPAVRGEGSYYTTPAGKPVRHPNAYRRAFGRPVYHCSTVRIEVGDAWLAERRIPVSALAV